MTNTILTRYLDPWQHFESMNRLADRAPRSNGCDHPAVNVWLNGENAELTAEIPGIDRDSLDITVSGDTVTLSGKRPEEPLAEGDTYYRHEVRHGDFCKSIRLPFTIDPNKVKAVYRKGVLSISLSQVEAEKPRSIRIKSE